MCSKIFTGTFQSTKNKHASSSRTKERRQTFSSNSTRKIFRIHIQKKDSGLQRARKNVSTCHGYVHGSIRGGGTNDPRNAPPGGFKGKYRRCLLYPPKPILKGESWPPVSIPYTVLKRVYVPDFYLIPSPFRFLLPSLSSTTTPVYLESSRMSSRLSFLFFILFRSFVYLIIEIFYSF